MPKGYTLAQKNKVKKVMQEKAQGRLHSGSKTGPIVKSWRQAYAIANSEAKRLGHGRKKR